MSISLVRRDIESVVIRVPVAMAGVKLVCVWTFQLGGGLVEVRMRWACIKSGA